METRRKTWPLFLLTLFALVKIHAQTPELTIGPGDLRVEQRGDAGYHLFIRAKPGISSVLLTETTKDPNGKADNYAYRAEEWNPYNGDEKRMLDGKFIESASALYSLIDSTTEDDPVFGRAFHIFIPWVAVWGYPWSRNGREFIADGTFINIRAFEKPYADYAGSYKDNPFVLSVTQRPFTREVAEERQAVIDEPLLPEPESEPEPLPQAEPEAELPPPEIDLSLFLDDTKRAFSSIANSTEGVIEYSVMPEDIVPALKRILDSKEGDELELVICLDTTESMADDIDAVKKAIPELLAGYTGRFRVFRLGLVLYRDYFEEYVVKRFEFTTDTGKFLDEINRVRVFGGRDIPEAVYEALYEALTGFVWTAGQRAIVLIGDAPPHPLPRGKIDKAMTLAKAKELNVQIDVIMLPH